MMPRLVFFIALMLGIQSVGTAAAGGAAPQLRPALVPQPAQMLQRPGSVVLAHDVPLRASGQPAQRVAAVLRGLLGEAWSLPPAGSDDPSSGARIELRLDDTRDWPSPEAYELEIDAGGARLIAGAEPGLYYAAVTLAQLLSPDVRAAPPLRLPVLRIADAPRFAWRGLLLDSARHFQSVEEIKLLLDAMSRLKLNVFHWHLTDDQGWRFPVPGWPRLISVGSCRLPAGEGGVDAATGKPAPYCGHYSEAEIREIVAYAAQRHIQIVPEVDIPGHATAAIAAYPELGVSGAPLAVSNEWGVNVNLFNAEEGTMRFLEEVMAQLVSLFPGRFVHIGGDEAVKDQWQASERMQARIRALGVKDEAGLQAWMVARLGRFLARHERRLIGWDEILDGALPPAAAIMSWRGTEGGAMAAKRGHDVVMNPSSVLYLDYLQTRSPDEPPGRPALIPLEAVYAFDPLPAGLDAGQARHILGVQANVWTEHMRSFERVQHAVFPRAAALAEVAWTPAAQRDYGSFLRRLPAQLARWQAQDVRAAATPFQPQLEVVPGAPGSARVRMSQPLGYAIRYTLDGSVPDAASAEYFTTLELPLPAIVTARSHAQGVPLGAPVRREITAASLRARSDEELAMCTDQLMLRLEDDGPRLGERAVFNVDIFNPCWLWPQAGLSGIAALEVRAGRIPYFFQLAHDEPKRRFRPAQAAFGELELRAGCDGPLLASAPLPQAPEEDGFITLRLPLRQAPERADLCLWFSGDTRPQMWALDRLVLLPETEREASP